MLADRSAESGITIPEARWNGPLRDRLTLVDCLSLTACSRHRRGGPPWVCVAGASVCSHHPNGPVRFYVRIGKVWRNERVYLSMMLVCAPALFDLSKSACIRCRPFLAPDSHEYCLAYCRMASHRSRSSVDRRLRCGGFPLPRVFSHAEGRAIDRSPCRSAVRCLCRGD